jgi:hypothetical protein
VKLKGAFATDLLVLGGFKICIQAVAKAGRKGVTISRIKV